MSSEAKHKSLRVKLERIESGRYRYDQSVHYSNSQPHGRGYFEIKQIRHSGATFDGWWEVKAGDDAAAAVALLQSLNEVRRFLAWMPSTYHRLASR